MPDAPGFGLYVHWPFCQAKCPYCDFNSHVIATIDQSTWADAYEVEVARVRDFTGPRQLQSIFFGGGTPSLMEPATVERVIASAQRAWQFTNDIEITLEANPTSSEANKFQDFRVAGVNRLSVGVQSLRDQDLKALGRLHTAREGLHAFEAAERIFNRASFDLIYARQHQTASDWETELSEALEVGAEHMSLYQLTIEPDTAFGDRFKRGKLPGLPSDDVGADMYDITQALTSDAGLSAYEISNHARTGAECQHNLLYWRGGDWAGIGPGAHGRITKGNDRFSTEAKSAPGAWLKDVSEGRSPDVCERLAPHEAEEERIMFGLRLREGVSVSDNLFLEKAFQVNKLAERTLIEYKEGAMKLTQRGRPLLNAILRELLA